MKPIRDVRFSATTTTGGGSNPSAIVRNVKMQANVRIKANGTGWVVDQVYVPHVLLTVTYTEFTTAYCVHDIPLAVTITTW